MSITYYKYKKLDNMSNFEDIIKNNRLYAATFDQFNDFDEGKFFYTPSVYSQQDIEFIKNLKFDRRILCLTKDSNNKLMWGYFSDGDRGIAIGVEITDKECLIEPVQYVEKLISISDLKHLSKEELVTKILIQKGKEWEHENEMRVFKFNGFYYVNVQVKEIILGKRVINKNEIIDIVQKYNPSIKILSRSDKD